MSRGVMGNGDDFWHFHGQCWPGRRLPHALALIVERSKRQKAVKNKKNEPKRK